MSEQQQGPWYVRKGNVVTGPFGLKELGARRDRLDWTYDVSLDKLYWVNASTLSLGENPDPKRRGSANTGRAAMVAIGVSACLGGLAWWMLGDPGLEENTAEGSEEQVVPPPEQPGSGTTPPAVVGVAKSAATARPIGSADAVDELGSAVGFVVCSKTFETLDGQRTELPFATGTCFAISPKGYLLTNRHVVEKVVLFRDSDERKKLEREQGVLIEPEVWVFFRTGPGSVQKRLAKVVFLAPHQDEVDLAVLKVDVTREPLRFYFRLAAAGSEERLKSKEVFALGFPSAARLRISEGSEASHLVAPGTRVEDLFSESDFEYVPQQGIVNLARREKGKERSSVDWILHSARISPGNSGGPLITRDAQVVGINTLTQRIEKEGISNYFALGITQVGRIVDAEVPDASPPRTEPPAKAP